MARTTGVKYSVGEINLTNFIKIKKPENEISLKAYVPSKETPELELELQGQEYIIDIEDIKDWTNVKQQIVDDFLDAYQWDGVYVDNKLNKRLERVGKPKNLSKLIKVANDEDIEKSSRIITRIRKSDRDTIINEALDTSDNVDELSENLISSKAFS